jgi:cyclic pyranopterin phosphate synthase
VGGVLNVKKQRYFSHLASSGRVCMVDVSAKPVSERVARARAVVRLGPSLARALKKTGALAKGNVIETARIAGIMAAKRTASLIPMGHNLPLDFISVDMSWHGNSLRIETTARCAGKTGVEMEALVAASIAALTVYDMCKSAGKGILIQDIRLLEKSGGKSGNWKSG